MSSGSRLNMTFFKYSQAERPAVNQSSTFLVIPNERADANMPFLQDTFTISSSTSEIKDGFRISRGNDARMANANSCPVQLRNSILLFGGDIMDDSSIVRQKVSVIYPASTNSSDMELRVTHLLKEPFADGACALHDGWFYLCFDAYFMHPIYINHRGCRTG